MRFPSILYTALLLTKGLLVVAEDPTASFVTQNPNEQVDLTPPPPQPNDLDGTVNGRFKNI